MVHWAALSHSTAGSACEANAPSQGKPGGPRGAMQRVHVIVTGKHWNASNPIVDRSPEGETRSGSMRQHESAGRRHRQKANDISIMTMFKDRGATISPSERD